MKRTAIVVGLLAAAALAAEESMITWTFRDAPLKEVVEFYTEVSGKPVRIDPRAVLPPPRR